MKSILFTLATFVACASAQTVNFAPPPVGTFGHTTVIANNTIFIQGGTTASGTPATASYAIILDANKSLKNATWQDTTKLSSFTSRTSSVAFGTDNTVLNCGQEEDGGMSCDQLDVFWYNKTTIPSSMQARSGLAFAVQKTSKNVKAYIVGGSTAANQFVTAMDIGTIATGNITSAPGWSKGTDTPISFRYATATWVDSPVNGIVVLGGQDNQGRSQPLTSAIVYNPANSNLSWSPMTVTSTNPDNNRYGHSAVSDANGNIFIFGGINSINAACKDLFVIDTKQKLWSLQPLNAAPEARAFHTATMLPDMKTMMIMWGQTGNAPNSATNTYMLYDTVTKTWSAAKQFDTISTITQSPNAPKPDKGPNGSGSGSGSSSLNIPLIAGICAAGVILLFVIIVLILLIRRRNRRQRAPMPTYHPTMMGKKDMDKEMASPPYEEDDKAKQAKAFMIRRPPSVYVVDDNNADNEVPHPNYKSQYYGGSTSGRDSPSVAEYELHGGGRNTLSTVSSVAERRRYVEEQQRQFREGYENTYNHPPPSDFNSHDYDDEDDEPLPNARRAKPDAAGPRYPRGEGSRGQQASGYEHPSNDYFV
ncbi:hypothetical protein B0O80DRAFT_447814 [Mortierella sp. GBAus27b]|nr:hypothetical protein B0O80DRAFT_447814 [Mortierella sp. GBAus27b]